MRIFSQNFVGTENVRIFNQNFVGTKMWGFSAIILWELKMWGISVKIYRRLKMWGISAKSFRRLKMWAISVKNCGRLKMLNARQTLSRGCLWNEKQSFSSKETFWHILFASLNAIVWFVECAPRGALRSLVF